MLRVRIPTIILLLILASAAQASKPVEVADYMALRKQVLTQLSIETLRANAPSYIGKTFEVRGTLSGFSKNDKGCILIINSKTAGSLLVNSDCVPTDCPGADLACLVKIGEGSLHSMSDLRLVACTSGPQLRRTEDAAKAAADAEAKRKAEAAQAAAEAAKNTPASLKTNPPAGVTMTVDELVKTYKSAVKTFNSKLTDSQADTIARSILGFSQKYQIDPRLVCAVILTESNFKITATSKAGAQGLGQLMPGTAAGLGVNNSYDPVENIYGSTRYIKSMIERLAGGKNWNELTWADLSLALAAYNAGPGAVKKHGGIPPYRETQAYVRKVISIYKQLCGVS